MSGVARLFHCSVGIRRLVDSNHVRGYEASPPPFMHTRVCLRPNFIHVTAGGVQEMHDFLVDTASPLRLRLNASIHMPGSVDKTTLPQVKVGGKVLSWKQSVIYLGSYFSEHGDTLVAVKHRICCAETVVKRLNDRVKKR